jgi:hypothetical protein
MHRGWHLRRFNTASIALAALALVLMGIPSAGAATSSVAGPQARTAEARAEDTIFAKCIAAARQQAPEAWVCTADGLTYSVRQSDGTTQERFLPVQTDSVAPSTGVAPRIGEDWDYWCETVARCSRRVNQYVAETKGNLTYGVSGRIVGYIDIISRQNFDGIRPRYRVRLIWDGGPGVIPYDWYKQCRRNITGPDPSCGIRTFYPGAFGPGFSNYWTERQILSNDPLRRDDDYHDDTFGDFGASTEAYVFHAAPLRGRDWFCDTGLMAAATASTPNDHVSSLHSPPVP